MGKITIIDDDHFFRDLLAENCQLMGHDVFTAESIREGTTILHTEPIDLLFLDVRLPDGNGLDLLPMIRNLASAPEVIIITGMGDVTGAELAIKNGAWDYLQKPLSRHEITLQVKRALEYHEKKLRLQSHVNLKRDNIVGKSPALNQCLDQVAACAWTDSTVLLTGETGTGKELFARAIHENSKRANKPFIVVDCASLPEKLIESILFGHVKGAFTGAANNQKGLIEQADGGTLFLDEIGELPLESQKTFLRVLQEKIYRPLGRSQELTSNFRLIAATNRDLSVMVEENMFRNDLFFRLNGFAIHLPSLRERKEDIEKIAMIFIFSACRRENFPVKGVVVETIEALRHYSWPGNVRELKQAVEKAVLADPKAPIIYPIHLPAEIRLNHIHSQVSRKQVHSPDTAETSTANFLDGSGIFLKFKEYEIFTSAKWRDATCST
jgi:two-component system NtrC family response regulator